MGKYINSATIELIKNVSQKVSIESERKEWFFLLFPVIPVLYIRLIVIKEVFYR